MFAFGIIAGSIHLYKEYRANARLTPEQREIQRLKEEWRGW